MATINYIEEHLKTFNVGTHYHSYWEIIYVTSGQGKIETETNETINYTKGDLICIPPLLKHSNTSNIGFKNIHLTITDWIAESTKPILVRNSHFGNDLYLLLDIAYRYFHQLESSHPLNLSLTDSIVAMLDFLIKTKSKVNNTTQVMITEIINNYTNPDFNLESSYKLIPLSKEYIRKTFISENGISPLQFLTQKRIELAKQLLAKKEHNLRINEIANSCGFYDAAYFSRIFKKETGFAPSDFQLNLLENNKIYT